MSNFPAIGDIVLDPSEKFKDENGKDKFDLLLCDGSEVSVKHPELIAISKKGPPADVAGTEVAINVNTQRIGGGFIWQRSIPKSCSGDGGVTWVSNDMPDDPFHFNTWSCVSNVQDGQKYVPIYGGDVYKLSADGTAIRVGHNPENARQHAVASNDTAIVSYYTNYNQPNGVNKNIYISSLTDTLNFTIITTANSVAGVTDAFVYSKFDDGLYLTRDNFATSMFIEGSKSARWQPMELFDTGETYVVYDVTNKQAYQLSYNGILSESATIPWANVPPQTARCFGEYILFAAGIMMSRLHVPSMTVETARSSNYRYVTDILNSTQLMTSEGNRADFLIDYSLGDSVLPDMTSPDPTCPYRVVADLTGE